ncbi:hypothetical protein [Streptomyces sp. enrichment culture]|uniref:hypothetical protein n=1 Tax=Streptomyces sp. enrichment culture TaxID=1795815 RepID=UPI003F54EAC0
MTVEDTRTNARTRLRRLLRHRTTWALTAATLVGALLGAGLVGWRTGTLPFAQDRPCWGSLSDETLDALLAGPGRWEAEDQKLLGPGSSARCRVLAYSGEEHREDDVAARLDITVRTLDARSSREARAWSAEFLSTGLTPLGGGLRGMASRSRAWMALPPNCVEEEDPVVVEARMGNQDNEDLISPGRRYGLARAVVETANGLLGAYGCAGRHRPPPLPRDWDKGDYEEQEKRRNRAARVALCGLAGAPLPREHAAFLRRAAQNWVDGGPVRVCGLGHPRADFEARLLTVVDPGLARMFAMDARDGGPRVSGREAGWGTFTVNRAVYLARCQTGDVAFLVEQTHSEDPEWTFVRDVFPHYVAAEAERLGCGPQKVTLPKT